MNELNLLKESCKTEKEKELFNVIFFNPAGLNTYTERHNISRQAANRQVLVMRMKFKQVLKK